MSLAKREKILVLPDYPDEAVVHRTVLGNTSRGIGVGYPGENGISIVWDAERMNLDRFARQGFADAVPHWNGRGGRSTLIGKDRQSWLLLGRGRYDSSQHHVCSPC